MIISFDIDNTWSLDPTAWLMTFRHFRLCGHTCIIVTGANQPQDKLDRLLIPKDAVIIVSGREFKERAALAAGYKVDVWIDDMPGMIQECKLINVGNDEEI